MREQTDLFSVLSANIRLIPNLIRLDKMKRSFKEKLVRGASETVPNQRHFSSRFNEFLMIDPLSLKEFGVAQFQCG